MKLVYISTLLILFAASALLSGCVSKGKMLISQSHVARLLTDSANTHFRLKECNDSVYVLNNQKNSLKNANDECKEAVALLKGQKSALQNANQDAKENYDALSSNSQSTIAAQAKKLKTMQDLLQSQKAIMLRLKKSISDALVNFKADELSVSIKDGKVYVSLQDKLLFESGSAKVDPKGKEALKSLANVLNSTSNINVMIEGHTDTIPINTSTFIDNWSLSVSRAASIVRILTNEYHFDSHLIEASGKGEFQPIKTNGTAEGRAANRRTEIILSPNLTEIFKLLDES